MITPIPFEKSNKPWFCPRKRAREFLRNRPDILSPAVTCQRIVDLSGSVGIGIQKIRFIDYCNKDEANFRYTIALVWTYSDASIRKWLYDNAADVVAVTGWYPLASRRAGRKSAGKP